MSRFVIADTDIRSADSSIPDLKRSDLTAFSSDAELSSSRQTLYEDGETLTRQHRRCDYQ
tara:strand:+ start:646 stop:825 length:180 start_codon:yes stop_codon:yes gene_type:complete